MISWSSAAAAPATAAAEAANRQGLSTAIVQGSREFGGLCIQRGCMPSKILLESANRFREIGEAAQFGVYPDKGIFSAREIHRTQTPSDR